eukprot:115531_1
MRFNYFQEIRSCMSLKLSIQRNIALFINPTYTSQHRFADTLSYNSIAKKKMTDSHTIEHHYMNNSDYNEEQITETNNKKQPLLNKVYHSFQSIWSSVTEEYPEEQLEDTHHPRRSSNIGPMSKEEWQEIMSEANKKIRSLQFTAMEQKQHLNEYMNQIDDLVGEQSRLRLTHKTELSFVKNKNDHQRVSFLQQIEKLQHLRDEMTNKFSLTEK